MTLRANFAAAATAAAVFVVCLATWPDALPSALGAPDTEGTEPAVLDPLQMARVELGRRLFFDPRVSRVGETSCASCHDPTHGFSDPAHPSLDEFGNATRRTMPLTDLVAGPLHSDGEFADQRDLLSARLVPLRDVMEGGDADALRRLGSETSRYNIVSPDPAFASAAQRVALGDLYAAGFRAAFGDAEATTDRIIAALEAHGASIRSGDNAFDRHLAGDATALSAEARAGMALFDGKAGCSTCHVTEPADGRALLRDELFHNTGVAYRSAQAQGSRNPMRDADTGHGRHGANTKERRRNAMRFKTPSLRDVGKRAPFMHDGSFATLRDVIAYYDGGAARHRGLDPALSPLGLSAEERDQLHAFIEALSSPERAGLAEPPAALDREMTLRLVGVDGEPLAGVDIAIEAAGDSFRGIADRGFGAAVRTDDDGHVTFRFPPTTHAVLRVAGHGLATGGLVPDLAGGAELIAVPAHQVALLVHSDGSNVPAQVRASPSQVVGPDGKTQAARVGDDLEFKLVRRVADNLGLYVTARPKDAASASRRRILTPRGGRGSTAPGQAELDLGPGGLTLVDMRPLD